MYYYKFIIHHKQDTAFLSPFFTKLEILISPESFNVIDGDSVVFQCRAKADQVELFVNGTLADEQTVIDKGFKESAITDIDETTKERTLTATALSQYNNTNIICRASITVNIVDVEAVASDPAILLIQGNNYILAVISNNKILHMLILFHAYI